MIYKHFLYLNLCLYPKDVMALCASILKLLQIHTSEFGDINDEAGRVRVCSNTASVKITKGPSTFFVVLKHLFNKM